MSQRFDGNNRSSASRTSDLDNHQADRAATDHSDCAAITHVAQVKAVERHPERLEQGHGTIAESVGHRVEEICRPCQVLPQPTIRGAVPSETDIRAQVVIAFAAALACVAGDRRVNGHTLPLQRATLHRAPELVTEDQWRAEQRFADPPLPESVEAGPAQADRPDAHQGLPGPGCGVGLIGEVDLAHPCQPGRLHGCLAVMTVALAVVGTRSVLAREMALDEVPRQRGHGRRQDNR